MCIGKFFWVERFRGGEKQGQAGGENVIASACFADTSNSSRRFCYPTLTLLFRPSPSCTFSLIQRPAACLD
jgi:hypothetical protein